MVCRSAKPALMTSHLCALSATRGCPAIAVFNLSKILAPLLNMNTVMAVGFTVGRNLEFTYSQALSDIYVELQNLFHIVHRKKGQASSSLGHFLRV